MQKVKWVMIILAFTIIGYIILTACIPVITDIVSDVSANISANPNIDEYVGAKEGLDIMPWVLYFIPGIIGITAIVLVLKEQ